ncbi:response regulator transcription factor [Streptomyces sp. NPDC088354]|uniref:helix-turn-helix transcriptional regulator n=1 Tax=Streptomyces sp. NPDC088354 TaxID=3365856 RepID=UPI0037F1624E
MIDLRQVWRERPRLGDGLVARADAAGPPVYPHLSAHAALSWLLPPDWGVGARGTAVPLLACVALYWRRRFPVALAVTLVVLAVVWPTDVPLLVALFTVAAGRPGRVTAAVSGFALLPVPARPFVGLLRLLGEREREVALAVAQGMTNAEIAASCFMSLPTVTSHVSHILTKLGLNNRVQIALLVYRAGLV